VPGLLFACNAPEWLVSVEGDADPTAITPASPAASSGAKERRIGVAFD